MKIFTYTYSIAILFLIANYVFIFIYNGFEISLSLWHFIVYFKYLILASFLFLYSALWFYYNTRDLHLVLVNSVFCLFCISSILYLISYSNIWLLEFTNVLLILTLLNMVIRLTGRYVHSYLAIGEIIFTLLLGVLIYIGNDYIVSTKIINIFIAFLYIIVFLFSFFLLFRHGLERKGSLDLRIKHWVVFIGTIMGFIFPIIFTFSSYFSEIYYLNFTSIASMPSITLMLLFFPIALRYGTYSLVTVPFQILFHKLTSSLIYIISFVFIYGFLIWLHDKLFSLSTIQNYKWFIHLISMIILIYIFKLLSTFMSSKFSKNITWHKENLEHSLEKIWSFVHSHRRIQVALQAFIIELKDTLALERVDLLLSNNILPDLSLKNIEIMRADKKDLLWKYLKEYHFFERNYLIYGNGVSEKLFKYLSENNYMLIVAAKLDKSNKIEITKQSDANIDDIQFAFLIGYNKQKRVLKMNEANYLREAVHIVNPLIKNYAILISEIEKRQRIRELRIAGQFQRKLPVFSKENIYGLSFAHSNKAAISVSGDYFDMIPLKNHKIACVLGDVSGHGLGAGYLASASRAIMRSHLQSGAGLKETSEAVNSFFLKRYEGNDFLTMVALIIDTSTGEIEYLNAAHPGPYLIQAEGTKLKKLTSFKAVMGILDISYETKKLKIEMNDRLFLYSDGVTETSNEQNTFFGEKRLKEFLNNNRDLALDDLISKLEACLIDFRSNKILDDDTTMAVLELNKKDYYKNNFLNKVVNATQKIFYD